MLKNNKYSAALESLERSQDESSKTGGKKVVIAEASSHDDGSLRGSHASIDIYGSQIRNSDTHLPVGIHDSINALTIPTNKNCIEA